MIVIDTSALFAILLDEDEAGACMDAVDSASRLAISAGTLAEAQIVAARKGLRHRLARLVEDLDVEIIPVTGFTAARVGAAYEVFGKGHHRAALNFGDCFAYEAAQSRGCPLLFVGNDFSQTDVMSALPSQSTGVMSGDLFGREEAPRQIERLFFGLMLTPAAAREAASVLNESQDEYGLRGRPIRPDRLHVTLVHVGDYQGMPPQSVIDALKGAGDSLIRSGFDLAFDRVSSFSGAAGRHPHVLLGDKGVEGLKAFRTDLLNATTRHGVKSLSRQDFTPHVTLSYADRRLPERSIRPISWRAEEFVLIHSEVGRSTYHTLGRWRLR